MESPEDYEKNRVGKYAEYFKGNEILPIPEIVQKLEARILSLVVTDLKTRRLVGLKKEGFEDLLRKTGVSCQYFCPATLQGIGCQSGGKQYYDKVLPTAAGIYRCPYGQSDGV